MFNICEYKHSANMCIFAIFVLISYLSTVNGHNLEILQKIESKINHNTATLNQHSKMLHKILGVLQGEQSTKRLTEVAFGKRTKESSVYYSSNLAFDGNFDTISCTQFEKMPYLEVDLGKEYKIKRVEVFNRKDCCGERLHDLDITIGPSHNQMSLCAHYKGPGRNGEHLAFKCHHTNKYARYVKLTIKGKDYLQVGEVKVYAVVD